MRESSSTDGDIDAHSSGCSGSDLPEYEVDQQLQLALEVIDRNVSQLTGVNQLTDTDGSFRVLHILLTCQLSIWRLTSVLFWRGYSARKPCQMTTCR